MTEPTDSAISEARHTQEIEVLRIQISLAGWSGMLADSVLSMIDRLAHKLVAAQDANAKLRKAIQGLLDDPTMACSHMQRKAVRVALADAKELQ